MAVNALSMHLPREEPGAGKHLVSRPCPAVAAAARLCLAAFDCTFRGQPRPLGAPCRGSAVQRAPLVPGCVPYGSLEDVQERDIGLDTDINTLLPPDAQVGAHIRPCVHVGVWCVDCSVVRGPGVPVVCGAGSSPEKEH